MLFKEEFKTHAEHTSTSKRNEWEKKCFDPKNETWNSCSFAFHNFSPWMWAKDFISHVQETGNCKKAFLNKTQT